MIKVLTLVIAGIGTVWLADFSQKQERYSEVSCEIDKQNSLAIVWLATSHDRHALPAYNIQFGRSGLVVRLPPSFYAPSWDQVDEVSIAYSSATPATGRLDLHMHNTDGRKFVEHVGGLQRSCIERLVEFIHAQVDANKSTVPIRIEGEQ